MLPGATSHFFSDKQNETVLYYHVNKYTIVTTKSTMQFMKLRYIKYTS